MVTYCMEYVSAIAAYGGSEALDLELAEESRLCAEVRRRVGARRYGERRRFGKPRQAAWERDNGTCVCGAPGVEVHHIHPLDLGGTNELHNLVTLCLDCHRAAHRQISAEKRSA